MSWTYTTFTTGAADVEAVMGNFFFLRRGNLLPFSVTAGSIVAASTGTLGNSRTNTAAESVKWNTLYVNRIVFPGAMLDGGRESGLGTIYDAMSMWTTTSRVFLNDTVSAFWINNSGTTEPLHEITFRMESQTSLNWSDIAPFLKTDNIVDIVAMVDRGPNKVPWTMLTGTASIRWNSTSVFCDHSTAINDVIWLEVVFRP